ncbi:proton-conducting transporter membrane subunit [Candidatus Marinarcus aquaticus]|uniref:Pesticidal protein Cry5Ba n=1 Tax=Candidatus Marinarcus aquaticus TaxID=2044504 RepID=A0A4Q0XR11_9BACT|nr:proton-conducting transporter membrane subunit [Candidatus Marinarcus aquaticus]RXJ54439.1 pesticidal protein Cry5Ba [Candidatus Marinarcus aquaticus]
MILLLGLPLLTALCAFVFNHLWRNVVVILCVIVVTFLSIDIYLNADIVALSFSTLMHQFFRILDVLVLLFFLVEGVRHLHMPTMILAIIQLILYSFVLLMPSNHGIDIIMDDLSAVMFLIINIVGGLITLFALEYIKREKCSPKRKGYFIALLLFFIAVMNLLVVCNSLELLFLCFELTTLCSYLLIQFRQDSVSKANALRALWMNQVGGIAILFSLLSALYYYETHFFNELFVQVEPSMLLPIALLVCAAYVKAASLPFHSWLLGAMVAPTPVSALLHSATMVKIAPFFILKLSVVFTYEISMSVALFGAFVFFAASVLALSKTVFKEILGLSTIALLALMMSLASLDSEEAKEAALWLMLFHSIAKALLFLQAGVLEKINGIKDINEFDEMATKTPMVLFYMVLGFASLTLPPFAAFLGKFMAIESLAALMFEHMSYLVVLLFILLGSVVLTLLYFKLMSKAFLQKAFTHNESKKIPLLFTLPSLLLALMLFASMFLVLKLQFLSQIQMWLPLSLLLLVPLLLLVMKFKKATYVGEYNCAERESFVVGCYSFEISNNITQLLSAIAIGLILITLVFGVFA